MGTIKLRWAAEDLDWLGAQLEKPSEAAKPENYPFLNLEENKPLFIKLLSEARDVEVKFKTGKMKGKKAPMKFIHVQVLAEGDMKTDQWKRIENPKIYTYSIAATKYKNILEKHEPLKGKAGTITDKGIVEGKDETEFRMIVFKLATWVQPS